MNNVAIRKIAFGCVIAGLVAGCATLFSSPQSPSIIFSSERDGNTDIYLAAADGSFSRRLTRDPAPDQFPRCSPNRRFAVFVRGSGVNADLYRLDLRTNEELRLTSDGVRDSTPEWSPDSRWIYFTKRDGQFDRIAMMKPDGTEVRYLTDGAGHDTMPGVSADGRALVHHTYRYGRETELQLFDLATGGSRRLTEAPGSDYEAAFAGNGLVLFSSNRGGSHYRIYAMPADGGGTPRLLADTGEDSWLPRYSAPSRSVLFYTGRPGSWGLRRVGIEGGAPVAVMADGHSNSGADWCWAS